MSTVSVLMTTYAKEKAEYLAQSLESMFGQTRPPEQVVLVLDGPVGDDQHTVIDGFRHDDRVKRFDVLQLPKSGGLARALNAGIPLCTGDFIARMDSDDISVPERFELQLAEFERDPSLDAVGSWSEEFQENGSRVVKICPVKHDAIVDALLWRNVLVHPSMMMRAEVVRGIGGYSPRFGKMEDYDIFVRLVQAGARFRCVPKVLVHVRWGIDVCDRRGGLDYLVHELKFRSDLYRRGFLNFWQYALTASLYSLFRLTSARSRRLAYAMVRR